jgi:MoxR-like ATPase
MQAVAQSHEKTPREKLLDLEAEINGRVFEREEAVRGFIVGLLSRSHVLFLGKKGAAKSMLLRLLCDGVRWEGVADGQDPYFRAQLTRDATTDELFGPVSAKGYAEDTFRRNTSGMLPEAKVALIEEVYKSNPTVLTRLLTIMAEGLFKNGTEPERRAPLRLLVGSSNELPDERDDSLEAFHDRFVLRYDIGYMKDPHNVRRMMERANAGGAAGHASPGGNATSIAPLLTEAEVDEAAAAARTVDASPVFDALEGVLEEVAALEIELSDRRQAALVGLIKAEAYLAGRESAERSDLSVLAHALWESEDHIADVKRIMMKAANPRAARAQEIFDDVTDAYNAAISAASQAEQNPSDDQVARAKTGAGIDANAALQNAERKLLDLRSDAQNSGATQAIGRIDALLERVGRMNKEVAARCLGI